MVSKTLALMLNGPAPAALGVKIAMRLSPSQKLMLLSGHEATQHVSQLTN